MDSKTRLSLSAKLTLSFFALLIIPLISGYFAYSSVMLDEKFSQRISNRMELELHVDRVTDDFHQLVEVFEPGGQTMVQVSEKQHNDYKAIKDKLQRDLNNVSKILPREDKRLLGHVQDNILQIDVLANQLFSAGGSISADQVNLIAEKIDSLARGCELSLSDIREKIDGRLQSMFALAEAERSNLMRRLIIAFAFLLLGPLLFWIAGRNIARPIYNLVGEAERLSAGNWDGEVTHQEGVEVGTLSDTLERMRENLVNNRAQITKYRQTLEDEVRLLQTAILPHEIPQIKGLNIDTFYHSATSGLSIGGDFYDFIPIPGNRWGLAIGDVSGRGIEAATLTALARFSLRSFAIEDPDPSRVLERLNKILIPQTPPGNFITIWYGVWDPLEKAITFGNGGHLYPLLAHSSREVELLDRSDLAVGIFATAKYSSKVVKLGSGDILVLYTDGLIEARSKTGDFLGEDRLKEKVKELVNKRTSTLAQNLGSFCFDWASGDLTDDVAIVALQVI